MERQYKIILSGRKLFMKLLGHVAMAGMSILATGCDLIEYHPYEVRLSASETGLNIKAFKTIDDITQGNDTISFILIGDTQRSYDQVDSFVQSANSLNHDFVIVAGDITDFGLMREFRLVNDRLQNLTTPYVAVIGNHDFSGNGQNVFKEMYGPVDDAFLVGSVKFIFLNTNSREANFNGRVPDLDFLSRELASDDYEQAIVVSHIPPFDSDFDPILGEQYREILSRERRAKLSLHAHQHRFIDQNYYDDHIRYMVTTAIEDQAYFLFKVWGTNYSYVTIRY